MPNPQPVTRVSGQILMARVVSPAPYLDRNQQEKTPEPYGELSISTDFASFDDDVVAMSAFITVRCDVDQIELFRKGADLDVWVRAYPSVVRYSGNLTNVVVYRFAGLVDLDEPVSQTHNPASAAR